MYGLSSFFVSEEYASGEPVKIAIRHLVVMAFLLVVSKAEGIERCTPI